jgi:hypothetical protein
MVRVADIAVVVASQSVLTLVMVSVEYTFTLVTFVKDDADNKHEASVKVDVTVDTDTDTRHDRTGDTLSVTVFVNVDVAVDSSVNVDVVVDSSVNVDVIVVSVFGQPVKLKLLLTADRPMTSMIWRAYSAKQLIVGGDGVFHDIWKKPSSCAERELERATPRDTYACIIIRLLTAEGAGSHRSLVPRH